MSLFSHANDYLLRNAKPVVRRVWRAVSSRDCGHHPADNPDNKYSLVYESSLRYCLAPPITLIELSQFTHRRLYVDVRVQDADTVRYGLCVTIAQLDCDFPSSQAIVRRD